MVIGNKEDRIPTLGICSIIAVFLTNISQLPALVNMEATQYLSYPVWIIMFLICGFYVCYRHEVRVSKQVGALIALFVAATVLQMILMLFTEHKYFSSSMFFYVAFSLVIMLTGNILGESIEEKAIEKMAFAFVASTAVVELNVYLDVFVSINAFKQKIFAYASKNSISLLVVTSLILCFSYLKPKNTIQRIANVGFIASSCVMLLMLKSRASILGLALAAMVILFSKFSNPKIKKWFWIAGFGVLLGLLFSGNFYEVIIKNVLLANNDATDINSISSGRIRLLNSFPSLMDGHWLDGIGPTYFECAPLSAILQFGLLVGFIYIIIMFYPFFSTRRVYKSSTLFFTIYLITIAFCSNAFFEGLAPFGPGAKCFFMWFIWGIALKQD